MVLVANGKGVSKYQDCWKPVEIWREHEKIFRFGFLFETASLILWFPKLPDLTADNRVWVVVGTNRWILFIAYWCRVRWIFTARSRSGNIRWIGWRQAGTPAALFCLGRTEKFCKNRQSPNRDYSRRWGTDEFGCSIQEASLTRISNR